MMNHCLILLSYKKILLYELKVYKEMQLICRALFFQSPTCTKANHLYISILYNQDDDQIADVV